MGGAIRDALILSRRCVSFRSDLSSNYCLVICNAIAELCTRDSIPLEKLCNVTGDGANNIKAAVKLLMGKTERIGQVFE